MVLERRLFEPKRLNSTGKVANREHRAPAARVVSLVEGLVRNL